MSAPGAAVSVAADAREGGFTLVELLLACVVGALVVGAGLELLRVHVEVARRLQARLASSGGAAWALLVASRDAQLAGADPAQAGIDVIAEAGPERLVLGADRDGSGAVDADSAERVVLARSTTSGGRFVRWLGAQSVAIAAQVRSGGLRLRYFDAAGAEIVPVAGAIPAADRARVRLVALGLDVAERAGSLEARTTLRTAAALRVRLAER